MTVVLMFSNASYARVATDHSLQGQCTLTCWLGVCSSRMFTTTAETTLSGKPVKCPHVAL